MAIVILVGEPKEIRAGRGDVAITAAQAAGLLGVSESTFRNLIRRGQIAACGYVGKTFVYKETDVARLGARRDASSE